MLLTKTDVTMFRCVLSGPVDEPERLQLEDRLLDRLLKALGKGQ